jgi:CrcB protein
MTVLFVALGGALGATLRYFAVHLATRTLGPAFPYGTLSVNVIGSLMMGIAAAWFLMRGQGAPSSTALFIMTGVLGGFTTFSAFSLLLMEQGRMPAAAAYIGLSVALSVGALFAGITLARSVLS